MILMLLSLRGLSLGQTAYMLRARLPCMWFHCLGFANQVPDANTL